MELLEHKTLLEQGMRQNDERITELQNQLSRAQMLQQRQIGALQLAEALLSEREDSDDSKSDQQPQPQHKKEKL